MLIISVIASFAAGYVSRLLFVRCNSYRMLKRLDAFRKAGGFSK